MTPAAAATAAAEATADDGGALNALARARLAEDAGDPRQALAALKILAIETPELSGLHRRIFDQAIEADDLAAAHGAAASLWDAGDRHFDVRLVLFADALRRSQWKAARAALADQSDKTGSDAVARLVIPPLNAWIDVGTRQQRPERHLLDDALTGGAQPSFELEAALVQLASHRPADAVALVDRVILSDRTSQLNALRVAATLDEAGESAAAQRLRGRIALAAGEREDPVLLLPAQSVTRPRDGAAHWFGLLADGFARSPNSNPKVSLLFARIASWLGPDDWQVRTALVEALSRNGRNADALSAIEAARTPLPAILTMRRAELLADTGRMEEAALLAETAASGDSPARILLVRYADIARRSNDAATAERALTRLEADLGASDADQALRGNILVARAQLLLKADDWGAAEPLLDRAVALRPNDPGILNFVGYSSIERRKNVDRSLAQIEAAWKQAPQSAAITDSLGWAYFLTGRADAAVPLLEKAQRGEPGNAVIVEHLGDAYWRTGRRFEARYHWRAAALLADADMATRITAKLRDGLTVATIAP